MEYIITLLPDCELLNEIFANVQIQSIHIVLCIKNKVFFFNYHFKLCNFSKTNTKSNCMLKII